MKIVYLVLSATLGASALVGIQILATDFWLWSAAPTRLWTNGLRRSRSRVDICGLESNAAGNLWRAADGHIPTIGYARGHCRRATSWSPGSGLQELSLGRHGLRWPALHSGPHRGYHSWNMGSATPARSLARGIENSQKLTLEIHLPVLRLHSSSVSTA